MHSNFFDNESRDYASELISKYVYLFDYYGNVSKNELKNVLMEKNFES